MPRMVAPPPSNEFNIKLTKPFSGTPTHTVTITGEPNRPAVIKSTQSQSGNPGSIIEKDGQIPRAEVEDLLGLVSGLRGLPSHPSQDIYAADTRLELHTFELQWTNAEEDPSADSIGEIAEEQKATFTEIVKGIESAGRKYAK